jgi:hypothetical protein
MANGEQANTFVNKNIARLSIKNPRAASILHVILAQLDEDKTLVISQNNLARLGKCSLATLKRSLKVLRENWVDISNIGNTGSVCSYRINERLLWEYSDEDNIKVAIFKATVLTSSNEQMEEVRDEQLQCIV